MPSAEESPHWNGGLFFNKADPRLLVPKRNPWLGYTLNLGHPAAEPALLATILLPLLALALKARAWS